MNDLNQEFYMRRAIELARKSPNAPFGAVIADPESKQILAGGWNRASENPTWHGEIDAINDLFSKNLNWKPENLVLFTTAEPCPMCQGAIVWSRIGTVVFGTSIKTLAALGWKQINISSEVIVQQTPFSRCSLIGGVLESECDQLFKI